MKRTCLNYLINWLNSKDRKPLVIRGARQVGKTWIVRHLADIQGRELIEVNLEKLGRLSEPFLSGDPHRILFGLETLLNKKIDSSKTILFIDEIQAMPHLFAALRWFAEDMPELPVIAAGSLLELTLHKTQMSMPVGRVGFMYMEPLSFEEFLLALNKNILFELLQTYSWNKPMEDYIHKEFLSLFKEYTIIGGMPAAVASWIKNRNLTEVSTIHHNLIDTYRSDIQKYSGRMSPEIFEQVLNFVPQALGEKFVYSNVGSSSHTPALKTALDLLSQARVCHKIKATAANGIPLGAEINQRFLKVILLDVGLCSTALNLSFSQLEKTDELELINRGALAEQVVGQLLRTIEDFYKEPKLYYWIRHEKGSSSEIDYVIQHAQSVVPIEVKAGRTGALKSLQLFMGLKKLSVAVRVNSAPPQKNYTEVKDVKGNLVSYELRSIPFYLVGQLPRLLDE